MLLASKTLSRRRFLRLLGASALSSGCVTILPTTGRAFPQTFKPTPDGFAVDVLGPTFRGLNALVSPQDGTGLPYDILNASSLSPADRVGSDNPYKSSGLEIGLYLAGLVAQTDLGLLGEQEALDQAALTLQTLQSPRARATLTFKDADENEVTTTFPYLWLDPRNGQGSQEIPAIDNAQLAYSLAVLGERFAGSDVAAQAQKLLDEMDFRLFERGDGFLALALKDGQHLGKVDLWGSEAVVAPLLGIIKDGVSEETLPHPGPSVVYRTPEQQIRVVPTFGGSLFTTLFPLLFWGTDPANVPEAILENARRHVEIHREEGKRLGLKLWGWAPAQNLIGDYHVYGVPDVSVFFVPGQAVVAAYASFLALNLTGYAPAAGEVQAAMANLMQLMWSHPGAFTDARGFVDSASPDGTRVAGNITGLDKGMEALSFYNYVRRLTGKPSFDTYFWAYVARIGKTDVARRLLKQRGEELAQLL